MDNHNFRVHLGDFIIPLFNWKLGLSAAVSQYCSKLKGEAIFTSMCLLGLSQHNYSHNSGNLLDLVFYNFTNVSVNYDIHVLVSPDTYHLPFVTEVQLPIRKSNQLSNISFRKYSSGGYLLLYNTLTTYDWSSLYNETSFDTAVARLVTVTQAIIKAVPTMSIKKSKFPVWFSENLKYYIKKRNSFFRCFKNCRFKYYYDKFFSYCRLIEATIKCDIFKWLKSIDSNLKTNLVHFWK